MIHWQSSGGVDASSVIINAWAVIVCRLFRFDPEQSFVVVQPHVLVSSRPLIAVSCLVWFAVWQRYWYLHCGNDWSITIL